MGSISLQQRDTVALFVLQQPPRPVRQTPSVPRRRNPAAWIARGDERHLETALAVSDTPSGRWGARALPERRSAGGSNFGASANLSSLINFISATKERKNKRMQKNRVSERN